VLSGAFSEDAHRGNKFKPLEVMEYIGIILGDLNFGVFIRGKKIGAWDGMNLKKFEVFFGS
jgi:hypothetical protein